MENTSYETVSLQVSIASVTFCRMHEFIENFKNSGTFIVSANKNVYGELTLSGPNTELGWMTFGSSIPLHLPPMDNSCTQSQCICSCASF